MTADQRERALRIMGREASFLERQAPRVRAIGGHDEIERADTEASAVEVEADAAAMRAAMEVVANVTEGVSK